MSLLGKKWIIKSTDPNQDLIEKLLKNRGILDDQRETYLNHSDDSLYDPFLFNDMNKAIKRIEKAIKNKERIVIFGDYDVDGISGTALLWHALKAVNGEISYRIPHRVKDGYGLSDQFVDVFEEINAELIITVDCGISNAQQISDLKDKGIDTIITDHHTVPPNFPKDAHAILHPKIKGEKYPFKDLTGSGVALKLAQALYKHFKLPPEEISKLFDLACLGTIADMGILQGENRYIVKEGIKALKKSNWKGLELIKETAKINEVDAQTVGFQIGPRINAAGRIASPYLSLQLLLHESEHENSKDMAMKLEEINEKRKEMMKDAIEEISKHKEDLNNVKIIIKSSKNWHVGIVGLIAGRLVDKYGVPAIILQDFEDYLVASCRSPEFFNIIKALEANKEFLEVFGGHSQAAGFKVKKENYENFCKAMQDYTEKKLSGVNTEPKLYIDCELPDDQVDFETIEILERLKPFGVGNNQPLFLLSDCELLDVKQIGKDHDHLKLNLGLKGINIDTVAFRFGEYYDRIREHRRINAVGYLEKNHWNGKDRLQMKLIDLEVVNPTG